MGMLVVSAVFVVILSALAYRANIRFRNENRLPMQWGITGAVNWSAPRSVALAFIPILAIGVLGFQVFMALNVPARAGQESLVFPVLVGTGVTLVAVQLLQLWLIERTLRRNAG
jgi:hypothetical protein